MPSMEALIGQFASLKHVKKIGEGTFGEAFKAEQAVFKIVPLEGSLLVNGEVQKRSEEILAEVAIALTLSRLREPTGVLLLKGCDPHCYTAWLHCQILLS